LKGVTIAIISCACFGLAPIFEKTLLLHMSPLALACLRSLTAGLILILVMEVVHKIREIEELSHRDALLVFLIAGMVGVFGPLFYLNGLKLTSVANALLIGRSNSMLIALFAWFLLKEKWTLHQFIGSILMVSGLLVIFSRGFTLGYHFLPGDLYIGAAAFMWASSAILMKKYLCHLPPEVLVVARNMIGGLVLLVFAFQDVSTIDLVLEIPLYLAGLGIFGVILAQFLWYTALEHTSASNVGLASISIPIFGTFFAAFFLGETLVSYQMIGGGLVLVGLTAMEIHLSQTTIHKLECLVETRFHLHHFHH
jgi:drug/metabolite transporter (DMT)-like permease